MDNTSTISIVIASYKYGHLASHCIESVLSQTRKADTIFFVDDGVGDCTHLPKLYPDIEYVLRETNLGIVKNFQDMLERVDTEYVMFLGADNWLRDDTLEKLLEKQADIITYDIMVTGDLKDEIVQRHPDQVRKEQGAWYWDRSSGHHGSMIYKTNLGKKVGYFSEGGRTVEDKNIYEGMLKLGAERIHIPEAFLYYRRHRENYNPC